MKFYIIMYLTRFCSWNRSRSTLSLDLEAKLRTMLSICAPVRHTAWLLLNYCSSVNMLCLAGHYSSPDDVRQASTTVHSQPAITSPSVPIMSAQGPMTSQQKSGSAAAAAMQSTSQELATTADSLTYSHTTLYVFNVAASKTNLVHLVHWNWNWKLAKSEN